ncbi:unnamed protein product [Sympodiomycopsis kandeliae]
MSSGIHYNQDLPPKGGYEPIRYRRNIPTKGPSGVAILGGVFAICAYGFWKVGQGNVEKRELRREHVWSRIHILPLLTAEADRDAYRRQLAQERREKEIMKDAPEWEQLKDAYHTKRYTPSNFVVL